MVNIKMQQLALSVTLAFYGVPAQAENASNELNHTAHDCFNKESEHFSECNLKPIIVMARPNPQQAYLIQADPKQPIQPVPASDGADYLKHIAGFNAIRNGGTNGDPTFRGMFGSRLKILNNGSEMLGACPARMDAPTSYIAPENFDQINIVKGPQTVLWGAASAATVNFSRDMERFDSPTLKAQASVMAASNHRYDTNLDTTAGDQLGYVRLSANTSQSDDYKDGNGDKVAAKWQKWNTDVAIGFTPSDNTLLELSAGKGDGEARYAGRGMDGSQFLRESLGLRVEQKNISDVFTKLEAQVNYNNADHVMDNYTLRQPSAMDMGGHEHEEMDTGMSGMHDGMDMGGSMAMSDPAMAMELARKTISARTAATFDWASYQLIVGADANKNQHKGRMGGRDYKNALWEKDADFQNVGMFTESTWKLNGASKVVSGLRIDQAQVKDLRADEVSFNETRKETLPSGFIRFENKSARNINSYIGLGYVDRMPDYWELFSPVHAGSTNAFRGVKTEQTTQLDMGLSHQSGPWSSWVSAYAGLINNYILMSYHHHEGHSGDTAGAKNVDATIAGGEAGVSYTFNKQFSADANLAYAWGRNDETDKPLPQIAPLDFRLGLNYQQDQYSMGALLRLVSKQNRIALNQGNIVGQDLSEGKGFGVFSVNAGYQVTPLVNVSMGIDNLFDKNYAEHLNKAGNSSFGYASNEIINDIGRNFWGKLTFKY